VHIQDMSHMRSGCVLHAFNTCANITVEYVELYHMSANFSQKPSPDRLIWLLIPNSTKMLYQVSGICIYITHAYT